MNKIIEIDKYNLYTQKELIERLNKCINYISNINYKIKCNKTFYKDNISRNFYKYYEYKFNNIYNYLNKNYKNIYRDNEEIYNIFEVLTKYNEIYEIIENNYKNYLKYN